MNYELNRALNVLICSIVQTQLDNLRSTNKLCNLFINLLHSLTEENIMNANKFHKVGVRKRHFPIY